jgi:hypothetical protein
MDKFYTYINKYNTPIQSVFIIYCTFFQLLVGTSMFFIADYNGIFFTHDSYYYYSAAKSLIADGTLKNPNGSVFTNWPPLYPSILYIFNGDLIYIKIFHSIVYVGTLVVPLFILRLTKIKKPFFILYGIIHTFSVTLISYQLFLLSEGLFILLCMILFYILLVYDNKKTNMLFIIIIILSNLICIQRMMGVYVVGIIFISLLLKKEFLKGFLYSITSLIGLVIWICLKQFQTSRDTFLNNLNISDRILILKSIFIDISNLFIPSINDLIVNVFVGIFVVIGCYYLFVQLTKRKNNAINTLFLWIFLYLLFVIIAGGAIAEINRFIVPVFPFLIMFLVLGIQHLIEKKGTLMLFIIILFVLYWSSYTCIRMGKNILMWHSHNMHAPNE